MSRKKSVKEEQHEHEYSPEYLTLMLKSMIHEERSSLGKTKTEIIKLPTKK